MREEEACVAEALIRAAKGTEDPDAFISMYTEYLKSAAGATITMKLPISPEGEDPRG